MNVKVVKFGGSSLASAEQIKKVAQIVLSDDELVEMTKKALDKAFDDQSIREDVRYIKSGGRTKHSEGEQWLRDDAEYDPAVDTLVNYKRLSPAQLELLLKMGVNRPESEDLMNYLHLYQFYLDNLK